MERLQNIGYSYSMFSNLTGIAESTIKNWDKLPTYAVVILEKLEQEIKITKAIDGMKEFKKLFIDL